MWGAYCTPGPVMNRTRDLFHLIQTLTPQAKVLFRQGSRNLAKVAQLTGASQELLEGLFIQTGSPWFDSYSA